MNYWALWDNYSKYCWSMLHVLHHYITWQFNFRTVCMMLSWRIYFQSNSTSFKHFQLSQLCYHYIIYVCNSPCELWLIIFTENIQNNLLLPPGDGRENPMKISFYLCVCVHTTMQKLHKYVFSANMSIIIVRMKQASYKNYVFISHSICYVKYSTGLLLPFVVYHPIISNIVTIRWHAGTTMENCTGM